MSKDDAAKPGARFGGLPVLAGLALLGLAGCVPPPYAGGPYPPDQVTYIDGQPVVVDDGAQLPVIFDPGYGGWGYYDRGHHWRPMRGDFQPRPGYRGPGGGPGFGGPGFGGPVPGGGGYGGPRPGDEGRGFGGPRPGYAGPGYGGPRPGYAPPQGGGGRPVFGGPPQGGSRPGPAPAPRPEPRQQQKNCPFGKYPC
jgi:hypothetical protein